MYSKRKQKRRYVRRWDFLIEDPGSNPVLRGGWWRKRRLCTAYIDEEQNWLFSNYSYYLEIEGYYQNMWADYYSGCL